MYAEQAQRFFRNSVVRFTPPGCRAGPNDTLAARGLRLLAMLLSAGSMMIRDNPHREASHRRGGGVTYCVAE